MASYNPPNFIETLSTFNPSNWEQSSGTLDIPYLNTHYLKFPVAQGTENLVDTVINGTLTVNGAVILDDIEVQNANVVGNADVNGTLNVELGSTLKGPVQIINNTDIIRNLTVGVAGGLASDVGINNGTLSVAKNTFLHGNLFVDYDATITGNINANLIKFNDGTSLSSGGIPQTIRVVVGATYTIPTSWLGKNVVVSPSTASVMTLPGVSSSTFLTIYNNSDSVSLTINTSSPDTFTGRYSQQISSTQIVVRPYQKITLLSVASEPYWLFQERDDNPLFYVNTTVGTLDLATFKYGHNATIVCTGSTAGFAITLPPSSTDLYAFKVINESSQIIALNSINTFSDCYSNPDDNLDPPTVFQLYPTESAVFSKASSGVWRTDSRTPHIAQRSVNTGAVGSYALINTFPQCHNINVEITSTYAGVQAVYIPNPIPNSQITIANYSVRAISISGTTAGCIFVGSYGTNTISYEIPPGCSITVSADGNNWCVDSRGGHFSYTATDANFSYDNNYSRTDCHFRFTTAMTATRTTTLPRPDVAGTASKEIDIYNYSLYPQTLTLTTGTFSNKYGTGTSTYTLPAQCNITLFSSGSSWQVVSTGTQPMVYNIDLSASTSYASVPLVVNSYVNVSPTANNFNLTLPNPNAQSSINCRCRIINTSALYYFNLVVGAGFTLDGRNGSGTTTLLIPPECWIDITSTGGTSYDCYAVDESAWVYPIPYQVPSGTGGQTIARPFYNAYTIFNTSSNASVSFSDDFWNPMYRGKEVLLKKVLSIPTGGFYTSGRKGFPFWSTVSANMVMQAFSVVSNFMRYRVLPVGFPSTSAGGAVSIKNGQSTLHITTANPNGGLIGYGSQVVAGGQTFTVIGGPTTGSGFNCAGATTTGNVSVITNGDFTTGCCICTTSVGFSQTPRITAITGTYPNYTLTFASNMGLILNANWVVGYGLTGFLDTSTLTYTYNKISTGVAGDSAWFYPGDTFYNYTAQSVNYTIASISAQNDTSITFTLTALPLVNVASANFIAPITPNGGYSGRFVVSPSATSDVSGGTFSIVGNPVQPCVVGTGN